MNSAEREWIVSAEGEPSPLRPLSLRVLGAGDVSPRFRGALAALFLSFSVASIALGLISRRWGFDAVKLFSLLGIPVYFTFYPPIIFSGILTLWLGTSWGMTVAYISTLVVSLDAGMSLPLALVFSFANPVGLFVLHTFISAFRVEPDLADFRSKIVFAGSALLGASASSSAAFVWALTSGGEASMFFPLWQGWILNNVLYFLLIVGPIVRVTGKAVDRWKRYYIRIVCNGRESPEQITAALIVALVVPILIALFLGFGIERQLDIIGRAGAGEAIEHARQELHYSRNAQDILLAIIGFVSCVGIYFFSLLFRQIVQVRRELARLSVTDALTGLKNRRFAEDQLDAFFRRCRRYGARYSIVLFDLDHFKRVNDRHGHEAGDKVLREVARCTVGGTRDVDISTRYGGEEFLLILPETDLAGARVLAERLRRTIEAHPVEWNGAAIPVTASFGTAEPSRDDGDAYRAVSRADEALYISKRSGRNRVT